jgi:hypothetical protein
MDTPTLSSSPDGREAVRSTAPGGSRTPSRSRPESTRSHTAAPHSGRLASPATSQQPD